MNNTIDPLEMLTPEAVSELLKIHVGTLKNWRLTKTGPQYVKIGDGPKPHIRYPRQAVLDWIAKQGR
jgi:hypothetical protein